MIADPARPDPNGNKQQGAAQTQSEQRELRRATSLLRLLKSSDDTAIEDEEVRQELQRLNRLLQRIDQIAEQEEHASESQATTPSGHTVTATGTTKTDTLPTDEPTIDPNLSAFDPAEFDSAAGVHQDPEPASEEPAETFGAQPDPETEPDDGEDENLARWWVNFNGDVSLERLARLRAHLSESPFTIETRFEEITDGLIVLRLVTDKHVSMNQIDWILRQLMDLVGLDRNSAILSRQ